MEVDRLTIHGIRPLHASVPGGTVPTYDSVTNRQLAKLAAFTSWINTNAPNKGCIGEVGWPSGKPYTTVQSAQWNAVGEAVYQAADAAGLDVFQWSATSNNWAQAIGVFEGNDVSLPKVGDPVRPLYTAFPQMGVVIPHLVAYSGSRQLRRGVSLANPLNNCPTANGIGTTWAFSNSREALFDSGHVVTFNLSGIWESSFGQVIPPIYNYGSAEDYRALSSLGVRSVRLPIRWERLQRTFNSALDTTELGRLDTAVQAAAAAGVNVTFSLHNFGGYMLDNGTTGVMQALVSGTPGTNQIPIANLTDFWTRLSAHYKAYSGTNLLSANDSGLETSVGNWVANTNCSVSQSTTQAHAGTHSLQLSSTAAGDMSAVLNATTYVVIPNLPHAAGGWVRSGTTARYCSLRTDWYDNTNTLISSSAGQLFLSSTTAWTFLPAGGVAPPTAAYMKLVPIVQATGGAAELHYFDDFSFNGTGVEGYEIMNEPGTMSQADWVTESAACVDAIRTTNGDTGPRLLVDLGGGGNYSSIGSIGAFSSQTDWISAHDSTGNYRYKVDFYFDDTGSGGGGSYPDTYTQELAGAISAGYLGFGYPIRSLPTGATNTWANSTVTATNIAGTGWTPSITFICPPSGVVELEFICLFEFHGAAVANYSWIRLHCSSGGGPDMQTTPVLAEVANVTKYFTLNFKVLLGTGSSTEGGVLTPGNSYTYVPQGWVQTAGDTLTAVWGSTYAASSQFVARQGASGQYPGN